MPPLEPGKDNHAQVLFAFGRCEDGTGGVVTKVELKTTPEGAAVSSTFLVKLVGSKERNWRMIRESGIDLSVGAIVGIVSVVSAGMMHQGIPWPFAAIVGLIAGGFVGALNGFGITKGNLQPFIMTLGMMVIAPGVSMTISEGQPISIRGAIADSFEWLGAGDFLGIPVPVWLLLIIAILSSLTLTYTAFGRQIYAVGDNTEAARLSGINVNLVTFKVYVISGVLAAVSSLILVSRLTTGHPDQVTGFELDAIAIVVIGGTSLFGGEGGVRGTLIGAAIVAVLRREAELIQMPPQVSPNLMALSLPPHKVQCMVAHDNEIGKLDRLLNGLPDDCTGQLSHPTYLEIIPNGIDKAVGLKQVGRQLGIWPREMAAIGDGENDLGVLSAIGLGIAMANAPSHVRRAAKKITASNDQEGVAIAIKRILADLQKNSSS